MGFEIREGVARTMWAPVAGSTGGGETTPRLYVGEIVTARAGGVQKLAYPYGWADKLHRDLTRSITRNGGSTATGNTVFGVVVGTNNKTPKFSTTYKAEYIDYLAPYSANSETYIGVGGPWAAGEKRAMVKIAIIDSTTVLRAPLYASTNTFGTAPSALTVTASTSGRTVTTATCGFTPVAGLSTVYFRSGTAAGVYRITNDTSTTVIAYGEHIAGSTAASANIGDTLVRVHLPAIGTGRMTIPTRPLWINTIAANSSNFFSIDVLRLDLSVAGQEYVDFRFNPTHFGVGNSPTT